METVQAVGAEVAATSRGDWPKWQLRHHWRLQRLVHIRQAYGPGVIRNPRIEVRLDRDG